MAASKTNKAPDRFIRLIKKAMDEHPEKLSLNQVARRADLSPAYLSFLLNGKRSAPSRDAIVQLAEALNIPLDQLLAAANKTQDIAPEFFRKEEAGPILHVLAQVPTSRLGAVRKLLASFLTNQKESDKDETPH